MSKENKKIDALCIDNIKINSCAMTSKAQKGDWASSISVAKILHSLFCYNLNFNPKDPNWVNRDRFIMANNNFLPALYSIQRLIGILTKNDIENYGLSKVCTLKGMKNLKINLETNIDDSSRNIVMAVGMAIAESILSNKFPEINHKTYVLCDEKDLQNGYVQEALSLAATLKLNKLIILCNSNNIQYDSFTKTVNNSNLKNEYKAKKFNYFEINNSLRKLNKILAHSFLNKKPILIKIKTKLAENTDYEDHKNAFNHYLNNDEISDLKDLLTYKKSDNFETYKQVKDLYKNNINLRISKKYNSWSASSKLTEFLTKNKKINLNDINLNENSNIYNEIISNISEKFENIIFMSPDQNAITNIDINSNAYAFNNKKGSKLLLGNRYLSIIDIANGIAMHSNFRPIISSTIDKYKYYMPSLNLSKTESIPLIVLLTNNNSELNNYHFEYNKVKTYYPYFDYDAKNSFEKILNNEISEPNILIINNVKNKNLIIDNSNHEKIKNNSFYVLKYKSNYSILTLGNNLEIAYEIAKKMNYSLLYSSSFEDIINLNYDKNKTIAIDNINDDLVWKEYSKYQICNNNLKKILNNKDNNEINFSVDNILLAIKKITK